MKNKIINTILAATILLGSVSCKKYLDINSDPDTTQEPSNSSVLPQCLAAMPTALQSDGCLYVAKFIQNWLTGPSANANLYDAQGYSWSGATMAATWNMTYYAMGNNLNYIIENASNKTNEPEFVGVALALKAWSFQHTTDYNSDIIFNDAFKPNTFTFKYDTQEVVYKGVDSICRLAISYLDQAIAKGSSGKLKNGDFVYYGDAAKWKRFVYGILARNWHHLSNKAIYNADSVIKYCDNAMATVNDDFCVPFDATVNNNANYFGTFRDNMTTLRTSNFIVRLLDGTALAGSNIAANRDPRMAYMLTCSQDTTNGNGGFRGVDPGQGDPFYSVTTGTNARKRVAVLFGDSLYSNPSASVFNNNTGKYLFQNKAVFPIMTYSEMQFIKAEAALRKGGMTSVAYTAYKNGIQAHFDFINRSYAGIKGASNLYQTSQIPGTSISKYLTSTNVKQTAAELTLTDIMLQKYIALWGWGFFETWVDLRRYHYTDLDPVTGQQVYKTFALPAPLYSLNLGKPAYRVRPHFTSEYTYNYAELLRVGAIANDYQTKEMWFSLP